MRVGDRDDCSCSLTGALLVAACGGDAGSTSDGPPAAPPAREQTEPETPQEIDQAPAEELGPAPSPWATLVPRQTGRPPLRPPRSSP